MGIGNLKVTIVKDGNSWFAEGLDIDYAVSGLTLEEAKENFIKGFESTIDLHIKRFGNLVKLLKPAPEIHWKDLWKMIPDHKVYNYLIPEKTNKFIGFQIITFISALTEEDKVPF